MNMEERGHLVEQPEERNRKIVPKVITLSDSQATTAACWQNNLWENHGAFRSGRPTPTHNLKSYRILLFFTNNVKCFGKSAILLTTN